VLLAQPQFHESCVEAAVLPGKFVIGSLLATLSVLLKVSIEVQYDTV